MTTDSNIPFKIIRIPAQGESGYEICLSYNGEERRDESRVNGCRRRQLYVTQGSITMALEGKHTNRKCWKSRLLPTFFTMMLGIGSATVANAGLTLNSAGIADGFSLSTFYSDPQTQYGVLSLANGPGGLLYGAGYARGELYQFNNVDGQTYGSQLLTAGAGGNPTGIATAGGQVYVGLVNQGIYKVDAFLGLTPVAISPAITFDYGLWGNPVNGHLIASTSAGLIDIDPSTGSWVQIGPANVFVDGVTVSPDGKIAYAAYTGTQSIVGYSLTNPDPSNPVFMTFAGHGVDGSGVISGGLFNGDIIVDNNDGTLGLINHVTGVETIIADGGSRGDLVSPDLSNGTLFLTQYEGVLRLSCGVGCSIGSGPTIPEPGTVALMGLALAGLAASRRRRSV